MIPNASSTSPASFQNQRVAALQGQPIPAAPSAQPVLLSRQAHSTSAAAWEDKPDAISRQDATALQSLRYQLQQLRDPDSSRLADILNFCASLKASAAVIDAALLWSPDAPQLRQLTRALATFLRQFDQALVHQPDLVSSLDAEAIRSLCHGLSVCASPGAGIVFDPGQVDQAGAALQGITDALLTQLAELGMPDAARSNGVVLDILNWVSRGLKSELLVPNARIRESYRQALELFAGWLASDHSRGFLSAHQLAKCAVQIDLMVKRQLVALEPDTHHGSANRTLLAQCGMGLCCRPVLDRLVAGDGSVGEVALINLCNAIKTLLERRVLRADDSALMAPLASLLGLIMRVPLPELCAGTGRTLSNCGNFVRALFELEVHARPEFASALPTLDRTCKHLVTAINGPDFAPGHAGSQTLSNLISFIKRCDKQLQERADAAGGALNRAELRLSAGILQRQLMQHGMAGFNSVEAIGGLLSGLSYLLRSGLLAPSDMQQQWMSDLLGLTASLKAGRWSDQSRALILPALQTLMDLNMTTLEAAQPALAVLMTAPASASGGYTRADLAQAVKALGAIEEATVALPPGPPLPLQPSTPLQASTSTAVLSRTIPGLTQLAPPMTTASALTSSTTAASAPARRPAIPPAAPAWQTPAKVARRAQQPALAPALSTQPVLLASSGKPPVASAQPSAPASATSSTRSPRAATPNRKAPPAKHKSDMTGTKGKPLRPEQEWFALFKGKGGIALDRVKQLARSQPALVNRNDDSGRNALFHAIAGGKADAVTWLMAHECYVAPASAAQFLDKVMAQVDLYSTAFGAALGRFLAQQSEEVNEQLHGHFARNPPPMQGMAIILAKRGLRPAVLATSAGASSVGSVNKGQAGNATNATIVKELQISEEYHSAENQDFIEARHNLAAGLAEGLGVVKDEEAVVKWFAAAQDSLHSMLAQGRGIPKDEKAAPH